MRRRLLVAALVAAISSACSSSGAHPPPRSSTSSSSSSTTTPTGQASGTRTVLSPVGLNVRAQPDKSAKVLGTAAQGAVLTVLDHTDSAGGWFQVKGATVTGWISGNPTLSAPGVFRSYGSGQFNALYPATWSSAGSPPASVVFRSSTGQGDIVVVAAANVAALASGRDGYGRQASTQILVCGVTSDLVTYQRALPSASTVPETSSSTSPSTSLPYLGQVRVTVDAQHALGFYADLPDVGPSLQIFRDLLASVTFPSPQCSG